MVRIDKDGIIIAGIALLASILSLFISDFLSILFLLFSGFTLYFFRDPERYYVENRNFLISPADGKILFVQRVALKNLPAEIKECISEECEHYKISIFMNVFNVHVNRAPLNGVIEKINYIRGKFFNASLDKASEFNERCVYKLKTNQGISVIFVQIAGLIARRIRRDVKEGDAVTKGQRVGIIRYGSRVDVYLPVTHFSPMVTANQTTVAGETIIATKVGEFEQK